MKAIGTLCALVVLASPIAAWAELNMQPGMWEAIMTVSGNQMPAEQKCYLQKDIDSLDRFQRGTEQPNGNPCSASGYKAFGNRATYTLTCNINGRRSVSAVTMNYDGNRITGEIVGVDGTVTQVLNTRIGDCTQSSFPN